MLVTHQPTPTLLSLTVARALGKYQSLIRLFLSGGLTDMYNKVYVRST